MPGALGFHRLERTVTHDTAVSTEVQQLTEDLDKSTDLFYFGDESSGNGNVEAGKKRLALQHFALPDGRLRVRRTAAW